MKLKGPILAVGASVVSAMASSLCCLVPIAALLFGTGGFAAATLFAKCRLPLLGATTVLLGLAWYLTYIARKQVPCECSPCSLTRIAGKRNFLLWAATVFIIATATFPILFSALAGRVGLTPHPVTITPGQERFALHATIPSMDCAACAIIIRMKLYDMPGVRNVAVTFGNKSAEVQYDPSQISSEQIISKINETGFRAESIKLRRTQ